MIVYYDMETTPRVYRANNYVLTQGQKSVLIFCSIAKSLKIWQRCVEDSTGRLHLRACYQVTGSTPAENAHESQLLFVFPAEPNFPKLQEAVTLRLLIFFGSSDALGLCTP